MTAAAMRSKRARLLDDSQPIKLRMYQDLWNKIAANKSDKPVKVRCPVNNQQRVIQGVSKEKNLAKTLRRSVEAVSYGRMIVRRDGDQLLFSLTWNGDMV